jgi:hypothetical protein
VKGSLGLKLFSPLPFIGLTKSKGVSTGHLTEESLLLQQPWQVWGHPASVQ